MDTESVVELVAVVVALPPTILILTKCYRHWRHRHRLLSSDGTGHPCPLQPSAYSTRRDALPEPDRQSRCIDVERMLRVR